MATKLPTVAIIGQANAGKSSLFNRLTRSRQAIVAREAGTTRDNVIGKVSYLSDDSSRDDRQAEFWLVDTAGLKDPQDEFEASIQEQITEAAAAADVIMVVTDSTLYPSDDDKLVAKKALRTKKPVLLVANKADLKGHLAADEFKRLGVKDIIPTSAEHGQGISDILDWIAAHIPAKTESEPDDVLRVALIGRPNAGKSYLFNTLAKKQQAIVANVAGTTRDLNRTQVNYHKRPIELIDTAGYRKPGKQEVGIEKFSILRTLQAIEEADICLLLMDASELNTGIDQKLAGIVDEAGKGLVIVVSKWDAVEGKDAYTRDALAPKISYAFKFTPWAPLVFTSSVTGQNVSKIFDLVTDIDTRRKQDTSTRKLNDTLQRAVRSHPPAGLKNSHPKLRYIVKTDTSPPWFVIHGANLKFVHWSYKRYLERVIRDAYDYSGTPIKFSFIDEKQVKNNRERIKAGKEPVTKAYKKAKDAENNQ